MSVSKAVKIKDSPYRITELPNGNRLVVAAYVVSDKWVWSVRLLERYGEHKGYREIFTLYCNAGEPDESKALERANEFARHNGWLEDSKEVRRELF